ncbi:hypothetical protein IWZ01DRAFT_258684 [Phyllosticta capitalensis]
MLGGLLLVREGRQSRRGSPGRLAWTQWLSTWFGLCSFLGLTLYEYLKKPTTMHNVHYYCSQCSSPVAARATTRSNIHPRQLQYPPRVCLSSPASRGKLGSCPNCHADVLLRFVLLSNVGRRRCAGSLAFSSYLATIRRIPIDQTVANPDPRFPTGGPKATLPQIFFPASRVIQHQLSDMLPFFFILTADKTSSSCQLHLKHSDVTPLLHYSTCHVCSPYSSSTAPEIDALR